MRPSESCSTPRFPMNVPRSGVAMISPVGVTRFCLAITGSFPDDCHSSLDRDKSSHRRCDQAALEPGGSFDEFSSFRRLNWKDSSSSAEKAAFQIRFRNEFKPLAVASHRPVVVSLISVDVAKCK